MMTDEELIDALCDVERGLLDHELVFVDEQGRRLQQMRSGGRERHFRLSEKQRRWALDIWERVG